MDAEQIKQLIAERHEIRKEIAIKYQEPDTFLLISESIDDYIEHRIQTDKVLEAILRDIQHDIKMPRHIEHQFKESTEIAGILKDIQGELSRIADHKSWIIPTNENDTANSGQSHDG